MKLKICGMKYPENILEIATLLPDYLGFIFYEKSVRYCNIPIPALPDSIQKVGVFVNQSLEDIIAITQKNNIKIVQLHGSEPAAIAMQLRQKGYTVIKAFGVAENFNFQILEEYENATDYFLFDTKGQNPGGNGYTFNWEILKKYPSKKPFFLSGGIGINEVQNLKNLSIPVYAIDVNSKFETQPAQKDKALLQKFKQLITNN